jgi:putative membrane protein
MVATSYAWVKAFHIIFVASWFAGLFYLPRIYVNLAQETHPEVQARLLVMARRLFRFMTILMVPAILLGLVLWIYFGVGRSPGTGWMHAKLLFVVLIIGYHHACWVLLKKFHAGQNKRSHVWFRWFNEVPVVLLTIVTLLVVLKPF